MLVLLARCLGRSIVGHASLGLEIAQHFDATRIWVAGSNSMTKRSEAT